MSYLYSFRSFRRLLGIGLLAVTCFRASAQTVPDTTRLSYGEELVTTPDSAAPLRVQPENRSLWKLGLNNFTINNSMLGRGQYYTRYGIHLAYERRLKSPAWTVLAEVSPAITHYRPRPGADISRGLGMRAQVAGRYYYNTERRLRLGKNATNFSANYISLALGAGFGNPTRESALYFLDDSWYRKPSVATDAAIVYGLQRRLGRYGFIDANVGISGMLSSPWRNVTITNSLRIGLAIGSQSAANYSPRRIPVDTDESLQPKAYAGFQLGAYLYRVRYSDDNPYRGAIPPPKAGVGSYNQEILMPYVYAGYYVRPRLAVQVGMQRQREEFRARTIEVAGFARDSITNKNDLALPVMLRYSLTRSFLKRWQFDVVGGVVPHWSSVRFQEQEFVNEQLTNEHAFRRRSFGMHASAGLQASYGFGRRRRVQATTEWVLTKDLHSNFQSGKSLQWGLSFIGLRYRFGYQ